MEKMQSQAKNTSKRAPKEKRDLTPTNWASKKLLTLEEMAFYLGRSDQWLDNLRKKKGGSPLIFNVHYVELEGLRMYDLEEIIKLFRNIN